MFHHCYRISQSSPLHNPLAQKCPNCGILCNRLINFRIAADLERDRVDVALASTTKVYGSESAIEILRKLSAILGASGLTRAGSAAAYLLGELEYEVRASVNLTFGGGTNEIQRELIAQFGLGMPRTQR